MQLPNSESNIGPEEAKVREALIYWADTFSEPGLSAKVIEAAARGVRAEVAKWRLEDLVGAVDNAYISSWQSTHAWQKQLEAAKQYLEG